MQDRALKVEQADEPLTPPRNFGMQLYPRMTEAKWLTSEDAGVMMDYALGRVSQRKLRLFAVSCCRRQRHLLVSNRALDLIAVAEKHADGLARDDDLAAARAGFPEHLLRDGPRTPTALAVEAAANVTAEDGRWAAHWIIRYSPWWAVHPTIGATELADLLRHIAGNLFRPTAKLEQASATLIQLAEALYAGEDCAFALRDALLDAGHVELAEHFNEPQHPKGCWALDLVLGRD